MKKCILGGVIILFAILFQLCSSQMGGWSLLIGVIGLYISVCGAINKD